MFCSKCGTQNEVNSKFCSKCGNDLNQKVVTVDEEKLKGIKVISIVGLVFSFILPPIGIILSAIALAKCNKYKKETNSKVSYLPLSIGGLIVSILSTLIIIFVALIFIGVFSLFEENEEILKSTWECRMNPYYGDYVVTATFNEDDFVWGKYGDVENNHFSGYYYITNKKYTNGENEYEVRFNPTYYISSGKESNNYTKSITMEIIFDETSATITSSNSTKYYCERAN